MKMNLPVQKFAQMAAYYFRDSEVMKNQLFSEKLLLNQSIFVYLMA